MPNFRKKKLKLPKTLGEYLKKNREDNGVSLELAERELKVKQSHLIALEEGRYDDLPVDVYSRGILKSYAAFLGLNYEKDILPRFQKEKGIHVNVHGPVKEKPDVMAKLKNPRFVITSKTIIVTVIVSIILGLGFYLWYQFSTFASAPELTVSQPEEGLELSTGIVTVVGSTTPGVDLLINGQKIALAENGSFKNRLSLQNGINLIEIIARNKVGKETIIRRNIMVELPVVAKGEDKKSESDKKTEEVEIEITIQNAATWLSIEEDGKSVYEGTMLPGSSQTFNATKSISITSGKGSNTLIKVNGEDWGLLQDTGGVVRDLVITKEMAESGTVR